VVLKETKKFEEFLTESFEDDIYVRELRLSDEEVEYVREKYPRARLKKCQTPDSLDGKCWYEINLLAPIEDGQESQNTQDVAIKEEGLRLRKELEHVKNAVRIPANN
jgi:hypothetical protein